MKIFRKVVDERQELEMMRVERGSFWVMLFLLAIVILVQFFAFDYDLPHILGESIVLILGGVWASIGYIRKGSWDYFTKPGLKTYIIYSLAVGFVFGIVAPLSGYFRHGVPLLECLRIFAIHFSVSSVVLFIMLVLLGAVVISRQRKLQQEYKEESE